MANKHDPAFSEGKPQDATSISEVVARAADSSDDISRVWNEFRLRGSTGTLVVLLVLSVLWDWTGGYVLVGIAAISLADAWLRWSGRLTGSLVRSVILDLTLIGAGIHLADLEPAAIGAPYLYMMAVPLLLLPIRQALWLTGYATAWALVALAFESTIGPPAWIEQSAITAIAFGIFAAQLLTLIAVVALSLDKSRSSTHQRLKSESALTSAAQKLLSDPEDSALTDALEAIRKATGADAAFVGENQGNRKTGPAAHVKQISADDDDPGGLSSQQWTLPYLRHREIAQGLSEGQAVRLDEALQVVMGAEAGSVTALGVPILVGGEWSGFLGIAYRSDQHQMSDLDLRVLETIAAMIGAYLERQAAYERLEQMIASKDQFLASISHEIRTPLTSVLGFSAVLKEDPEQLATSDGREIIELIEQQAIEAADLVEDLLVAARADIDAINVVKEPLRLSDEIDAVLSARLGSEQADIFVASSPTHRAIGDRTRVRQIIRNLLTNALRYGGDQITITTHRDGPEVLIVFSDNGPGVPPELSRRIFDPYERGERGHVRPESIGLGLAVSRQLARLMDGDLTLRSDLSGATFQLALPRVQNEDDQSEHELPEGAVVLGSEVHITVSAADWGAT